MVSVKPVLLVVLLVVAGCESTPSAPLTPPTWSDSEPTVRPTRPVERNVGRVVIHTPRRADPVSIKGTTYPGVRFRGYKLYDEHGTLVKDCPGHSDVDAALTLETGSYIVFAVLEHSLFNHRDQTIQFVVVKGETTYVDMTKPPTSSPLPEH